MLVEHFISFFKTSLIKVRKEANIRNQEVNTT